MGFAIWEAQYHHRCMEAHRTQAKVAQARRVQVAMEAAVDRRLQAVVALELRGTFHNSSVEEASTLGC